jgi:hypothetical protein
MRAATSRAARKCCLAWIQSAKFKKKMSVPDRMQKQNIVLFLFLHNFKILFFN